MVKITKITKINEILFAIIVPAPISTNFLLIHNICKHDCNYKLCNKCNNKSYYKHCIDCKKYVKKNYIHCKECQICIPPNNIHCNNCKKCYHKSFEYKHVYKQNHFRKF
jgi:hypothetical protein